MIVIIINNNNNNNPNNPNTNNDSNSNPGSQKLNAVPQATGPSPRAADSPRALGIRWRTWLGGLLSLSLYIYTIE